MLETAYQRKLIRKLETILPGCFVIKLDPLQYQGIPDLLILFEDRWAALETKRSRLASERPNQSYYIQMFNVMSFAAFINPENESEVLHDLQLAFRAA